MRPPLTSAVGDLMLAFNGVDPSDLLLQRLGRVPATVLEVGCGSGKLGLRLALNGSQVTQLDPDPDYRDYAQHLAKAAWHVVRASGRIGDDAPPFTVIVDGDAREMSFPSDSFDVVFNEGTWEHWSHEDQVRALKEAARVSRAFVLLVIPDAADPESQRIAKEVHHHYVGLPEHEIPLTAEDCRALAKEAGLEVRTLEPCLARFHFLLMAKPGAPIVPAQVQASAATAAPIPMGPVPGMPPLVEAEPLDVGKLTREA